MPEKKRRMTSRRREKQNDEQNYFGIFSGMLQTTPLTRNLAPRFHLKVRGREGEELGFRVALLGTSQVGEEEERERGKPSRRKSKKNKNAF